MKDQKWILSQQRYTLEQAAPLARQMLKQSARINLTDLAAGWGEDGEEIITCRIAILEDGTISEDIAISAGVVLVE